MNKSDTGKDREGETLNDGGRNKTSSNSPLGNLRLSGVIFGLWVSLFLCSLETTIVSTSLIHVANDINDLGQASWIVIAYLLTFNAFILIWAKLCDTFDAKWLLLASNILFCVFSIACAVSKTMVQLIIFRAFQGIGGSGMYSLTFVVLAQITPMDKLGLCTGILSSVFALANLLGPVLGGVISDRSTWRWIFWLNVPGVALALVFILRFMPGGSSREQVKAKLKRTDIFGAFLSLAWAILLVFALQEGGKAYEWSSGAIIGPLVSGVVVLFGFAAWEWYTYRHTNIDSLFPVGLLKRSVVVLLFLSLLLLGFTFYVPIILIPQRFQYVNGTTATRAGILLLPLTLISPMVALVAGSLVGKHRYFAPGLTIAGACINVVGIALMGTLPVDSSIPVAQYGYQVLMGFSVGLTTPSLLYLLKLEVDEEHLAGAMGVGNMGRTLGGCVGLAICNSVLQSRLDSNLHQFLTQAQIDALSASSSSAAQVLTAQQLVRFGEEYGRAYNMEFKCLITFSGLSLVTSIFLWFSHAKSPNYGAPANGRELTSSDENQGAAVKEK